MTISNLASIQQLSWLTIVAEERDDKVVAQCHKVHSVAEEIRHGGEVRRYYRQEQELEDVEEGPDW